jgi:large subunit ribosomal protein L7/L12
MYWFNHEGGVSNMTKEEIIDALSDMTVLELSELVAALEEKFGVSAAAPVAVAAVPGAAAAPVAVEAEEKSEYNVVLQEVGPQKIQVIKVVRELTGLGLRESKAVVDEAPGNVMESVTKEEADAAKAALEEVGATIELT